MATVDGVTPVKVQDLVDEQLITGHVSSNGHLILENRAGAQIDAGLVAGSFSPLDAWPIGSIYISAVATDPATLFGGGTWVRFGQGRVMVSQDDGQTEFDTAEETGGEKSHVLTAAEMPTHTHSINHDHGSFSSSSDNNHSHTLVRKTAVGTSSGVAQGGATSASAGTTDASTAHSHTIDPPAFIGTSGSAGSDGGHNNLQPYIVVYAWKRTA